MDACGLVPTGRKKVTGVHGEKEVATFLVNISLPNNVSIYGVPVTLGDFGKDADVLIGMDIINRGDFAVTNLNGITKFSFRFPSQVHIDFVEETRPHFQHGGSKKGRAIRQKPTTRGGRRY